MDRQLERAISRSNMITQERLARLTPTQMPQYVGEVRRVAYVEPLPVEYVGDPGIPEDGKIITLVFEGHLYFEDQTLIGWAWVLTSGPRVCNFTYR